MVKYGRSWLDYLYDIIIHFLNTVITAKPVHRDSPSQHANNTICLQFFNKSYKHT